MQKLKFMKILITGAKGILGRALNNILSDKYKILSTDIGDLDITNYEKVINNFESFKPSLVIHCAAHTNVDGCELDPEKAYLVNSTGTQNIALACQKHDAAMVYISTDFIFDGKKGNPYLEIDPPNPISVYGKSKLMGEACTAQLLNKFFIVRTSWIYGSGGKNFVDTIIKLAEEKDELRVVDDQVGSPTYARDLAEALAELIKTPFYGIYHITNSDFCSWYEFSKDILRLSGFTKTKIIPITSEELKRPAPRPHYSVLSNQTYRLRGFKGLRSFKDALKDYLA